MIGMMPPGAIPGQPQGQSAPPPYLRSKTMYLPTPQLVQLLSSDDTAVAKAAQDELTQRGISPTANHAQLPPALRAGQAMGSAAGGTAADAVLGGALPGDQSLQADTANH